ncbi:YncE family protein [Roseomonas sp. HF4]|jgi:YVTN family beta-propeller protein|uniref:YncE family protein n=1 Tax=Roseomonas sp. HF4 TaxID=2562313 RepID=UPI0010BF8195|nr:beta-propeller fold lactonase family protein [Roseomonas sp. HF4]
MPRLLRRELPLLLIGGGLLPAAPLARAAVACAGTVFTADEGGASISAVDLTSGRVHAATVPIVPHNVEAVAGGRKLFAVGIASGAHGADHLRAGGRLVILEPVRGAAPRVIDEIPAGRHPGHVVADAAGERAFITDSETDALLVVDVAQRRIAASVPVGDYPHGLRLSPDGREAWLANVRDGTVSVVDIAAAREVARIPAGPSPVQVGFVPDGSRAYVSLRGANAVAEIDARSRRVLRRIQVGRGPVQLFATPDGGFLYVANEGTRNAPGTTASVIDLALGSVIATIETGRGAHGVVVCGNGTRAFVTNLYDDTLTEIDVTTRTVRRQLRVGRTPNGVTWAPA